MQRLKLKRGDNLRAVFSFKEGTAAADITGCEAWMQVRGSGDTLVLEADTGDYLTVDGGAGTVTANIPATLTDVLEPGDYLADVQLTYSEGAVRSSDTFRISVSADVTYDR